MEIQTLPCKAKLENEIENLNKIGVNTTELEAKLANYNALMDSARENNEAAKIICSLNGPVKTLQ